MSVPDPDARATMVNETATNLLIELVRKWPRGGVYEVTPESNYMLESIIPRARAILGDVYVNTESSVDTSTPRMDLGQPPNKFHAEHHEPITTTDKANTSSIPTGWLVPTPQPPPKPPEDLEAHLMGIALKAVQDALQAEREPSEADRLRESLLDMTEWIDSMHRRLHHNTVGCVCPTCTSVARARKLLAEGGGP